MTAHDWHRPNLFNRDVCAACQALRYSPQGALACPGGVVRVELPGNVFGAIERKLVGYFDEAVPGAVTLQEASEWYAEVGGERISLSALALAIAQGFGDAVARS